MLEAVRFLKVICLSASLLVGLTIWMTYLKDLYDLQILVFASFGVLFPCVFFAGHQILRLYGDPGARNDGRNTAIFGIAYFILALGIPYSSDSANLIFVVLITAALYICMSLYIYWKAIV